MTAHNENYVVEKGEKWNNLFTIGRAVLKKEIIVGGKKDGYVLKA